MKILTGEVEVSDAEFGALDMHRQVDFAASREVLDVAIAAVLGATRDRSSALLADLFLDVVRCAARVHIDGLGWLGNDSVHGIGRDEFAFSFIPYCEHLGRWCTAENTGMDQAGEADVGNVAGGTEDAFKVPDCLCAADPSFSSCERRSWS